MRTWGLSELTDALPCPFGGTFIREDEAAIVFQPDGGFHLLIPDMPGDDPIPDHMAVAVTLAAMLQKDGFREQIGKEWIEVADLLREPPIRQKHPELSSVDITVFR